MRRREVLAGAVGLFVPVAVAAQEPGRTYRIGVVSRTLARSRRYAI